MIKTNPCIVNQGADKLPPADGGLVALGGGPDWGSAPPMVTKGMFSNR